MSERVLSGKEIAANVKLYKDNPRLNIMPNGVYITRLHATLRAVIAGSRVHGHFCSSGERPDCTGGHTEKCKWLVSLSEALEVE